MRETGEVVTDQEFVRMFRNTSIPKILNEGIINSLGGDIVFEGPQASGGTVYQYSQYDGVEEVEGKWFTKYILGPVFSDYINDDGTILSAEDQELAHKSQKDFEHSNFIRDDRTKRLLESDWTQVLDASVDQTLWATYRQELRDITAQEGFPWNVVWPEKPK
jgi:hypothetical protein